MTHSAENELSRSKSSVIRNILRSILSILVNFVYLIANASTFLGTLVHHQSIADVFLFLSKFISILRRINSIEPARNTTMNQKQIEMENWREGERKKKVLRQIEMRSLWCVKSMIINTFSLVRVWNANKIGFHLKVRLRTHRIYIYVVE